MYLEKSMYSKLWFPLLAFVLLLNACTAWVGNSPHAAAKPDNSEVPSNESYSPAKSDESMKRGNIRIDSLEILSSDSFPLQYQLKVQGSLPTSCHELRTVVDEPNLKSEIRVQIYSVYDPYTVCTQVSSPFDTRLALGSYIRGSYTVLVNDKLVGEITP
jgi:inhibitor of cysteine peptidase